MANSELDKCKNYCTELNSCWGCTNYCNDTCGWYAISECNYLEDGTNPNGRDVSQKPGVYVTPHKLPLNIYVWAGFHGSMHMLIYFIVCLDIKLSSGSNYSMAVKWKFGRCSSSNYTFSNHGLAVTYIERCWLKQGRQRLTCFKDDQSLGWKDTTIEIEGHTYCDDFITFKAMRQIEVLGKSYDVFLDFWNPIPFY